MAKKFMGRQPLADSLDGLPLSTEERRLLKFTLYKHWVKEGIIPPFEDSFTGITMAGQDGSTAIMNAVEAEIKRRRAQPKDSQALTKKNAKATRSLRAKVEKAIRASVGKALKARENAAKAKALRDKTAKAEAARAKATREKAAKARVAKDKAARDKAARDKAAKARAAKDKRAQANMPRKRTSAWQVSANTPVAKPATPARGNRSATTRAELWDYLEMNYMEWVLKGASSAKQFDYARAFIKGRGLLAMDDKELENELRRFRESRQAG
jgi:hypothetical protein